MRWEHLFQTHILLRGMELFERCAVHHLQKKEDRIEAVVEGGRRYEVEIKYQQGEVTGLYCDCPHAEEGNHCKHMAAVFYAEQEAPEETYVVNGELADEEIAFIRARLQEESEETLRRLLFDLLVRNPRLARQYAMYHTKGLSEKEYARLNNQIVRIIDAYTDRNSYADYEDAWRLAVALCQFVEDEIQALIDAGHLREAINLIFSMVENYGATDIDDSAGGTQDLLERLSEASIQVLRGADIELKRSIFDAIIESHDGVDNDLLQAYLDELLFEEFLERIFGEEKRNYTKIVNGPYDLTKGQQRSIRLQLYAEPIGYAASIDSRSPPRSGERNLTVLREILLNYRNQNSICKVAHQRKKSPEGNRDPKRRVKGG